MKWLRSLFNRPAAQPATPSSPSSAEVVTLKQTPAPQAGDAPEVWLAAICQTSDKTQALTWLAGFNDEAGIAEVAVRARNAEVRFAAVRRIETITGLERIAQASRDKDKRVYRHCADLLKKHRQAEASARRAGEIAEELRALLVTAPLPNTRLLDLNKTLQALADAGEPGQACQALMQQALAQLHQESEALRDLNMQQKAAVELDHELTQAIAHEIGNKWVDEFSAENGHANSVWGEQLAGWQFRLAALHQAAADLPPWLAAQAAAKALRTRAGEIETRLAGLVVDHQRSLSCLHFLAERSADALPADEAWSALAKPENPVLRAALSARWQTVRAHAPVPEVVEAVAAQVVEAPTRPKRQPKSFDQDALRGWLDQLEQAIAEGHLADADAAAKRIKSDIGNASLPVALDARLHNLLPQLETLRGWARWGTQQARDKLIEAAQGLLVGKYEVAALAAEIHALREAWKQLNAHAAASKAQWEKFDALLEQAYQPVAEHRAEQAARQAEACAAREALCAEWETELAGIDWSQADFKAVETRRAALIQQWRAAPQAGFRDERVLRKRFDALISSISQKLDAARSTESQRREQLIGAAEALAAQSDLRQAMREARTLQQAWSQQVTPVRLKRGDDQKQWVRFRAACNRVYERLDAQRAEQAAERQAEAQARQDEQQARQHLEQVRQEKHRARFELIARKAGLASRVEQAALAGQSVESVVAECRQAWEALDHLPGKSEDLLVRRFVAAADVTAAELDAGRELRDALLLDLEISLDLASPASLAEVRRERQLDRLQNRFGASAEAILAPEDILLRCYATAALPDAVSEQRLAAVVRKLAG